MKINSIIFRYFFKELLSPLMLNMMFFTFIFLMTEILEITHLVVNYDVSPVSIGWLLFYSLPYFLVFVIPMSVMMAVLLTFLRMSGDNEIIALKAGGVGLHHLLPAVLVFCLAGSFLTGWMIIWGLPWSRLAVKEKTLEIAKTSIDVGLKPRAFNNSFGGVMLYVGDIDKVTRELKDVFIQDERNREGMITVVAPRGRIFMDPDRFLYRLILYDGAVNQADLKGKSANSLRFDTYELSLDLHRVLPDGTDRPKKDKEMSLQELRRYIEEQPDKNSRYYGALIEYHKKFSIPFACLALGILAVPLGVQSKAAKKSFGLGLGLVLFLLYYLLLSAGVVLGEAGRYPPVIGMWIPNLVTGGIGVYLLHRTIHDRPVAIDALVRFFRWNKR